MKEIRATKNVVRRSVQELAVSAACLVLSGLLIFVSRTATKSVQWFDYLIFALSIAAVIVSSALLIRSVLVYKNARIAFDDDGFTEVKYNKKEKSFTYADIRKVTYYPERERAEIELRDGGKINLLLDYSGSKDFYRLLLEKSKTNDFTVG